MKSLEELKALKEKAKAELSIRDKEYLAKIEIAMSTCGITAGAREVLNSVLEELKVRNLTNVQISQTGCPGLCFHEPLLTIIKPNQVRFVYGKVTPERVKKIISSHVINDQPVKEWLINLE
ncbi:MAG: NADP-reducing hydrogenase subunit HndB [Clostridia bacterium]|jgi:NADP-reducing hydrogenase subunit HndB|nr:NADP-reducing hydrogenase subunit HndB [Clostridia bacterium]MDN5323604.1 NADP-reducing hydrogenase subunit HndB [Clostridia bacterium]